MRKTGTTIAATTLLVAMLAGCGGKSAEDRMAEAAASAMLGTDVSVDDDGETVTLGSGDEAMTITGGDNAQLPTGFPDNIFLPDDYKVDSSIASGEFTMVTLRAPGEVGALADAAKANMESGGWKQQMMAGDENSRIYAFRNEQTVASLSFDRHDEGGVLYTVQLSKAPD